MSGSSRDTGGRTELRPCDWRPRGNAATVLVFPQGPIAPDHKCRNSVWLESASRSRNWLAWEPRKHCTDWECPQSRIHSHPFGEWLAWPDRNAGGSVLQWRSCSVFGMPTRLPESIPIWLSLPVSCREMSLISLVILSVEGSPWHISGWIFGRSSWIREAPGRLWPISVSASPRLWRSSPNPCRLHREWNQTPGSPLPKLRINTSQLCNKGRIPWVAAALGAHARYAPPRLSNRWVCCWGSIRRSRQCMTIGNHRCRTEM